MMQNLQREAWYLGDLAGVPIFLHWTAIIMVFMCWRYAGPTASFYGCSDAEALILVLIVLVIGILLHELGHGLTARALGAFGITITLWAFGGVCRSTRDSARIPRELAIVAAGPLVSLALWQGSKEAIELIQQAAPHLLQDADGYTTLSRFLAISASVNLSLLMFNILPIYPLDGGQFVYQSMRLCFRDQLLVRQISLSLAVLGAVAYFCWSTHLFDLLGLPDGVRIWYQYLGDNLGMVATRVILLFILLQNAFLALA